MPVVNSKERAVFAAVSVAACAGCVMGIGSLLLYQRLQRDSRGLVEPLRRDLVALRRELEDLRLLVNSLRNFKPPSSPDLCLPGQLGVAEEIANGLYESYVAKRPSAESSPSPDGELEFFDAASEQATSDGQTTLSHSASNGFLRSSSADNNNLNVIYGKSDALLATHDDKAVENRRRAYEMLRKYYSQNKSNYEYLWRLSRVTYMYGRTLMGTDEETRKQLCIEAKDYAFEALSLNDESADVHKWCALTVGTMGDFVGIRQKLADGWTFKQHIDIAVKLRSSDGILRHLSGRWLYGVADLSWFERKIATAIFSSNIPAISYDAALAEFLEADRLKPNWKENMLYIALCYHNKGDREQARRYLETARDMVPDNIDDLSAEKDIEKLWQDYYYK